MYRDIVTLPTPKHARLVRWSTRNNTNDAALVVGIIGTDEYDLGLLGDITGTAVDLGAHIGIVAVALAIDHPGLHVIAIEPVSENVEGLRRNVELNGLADRITVIEAAGTEPGRKTAQLRWNYRTAEGTDQAYIDDSRFIANIFGKSASDGDDHRVPAISLDDVMAGLERLALLKVDCEGCEWAFLRSPRIADVDLIIGEFHNQGGLDGLQSILGATHKVWQTGGAADVGIFRAVRQ